MNATAGVDTVAITIRRPDIVRELQALARISMAGGGKQFIGRPGGEQFQVRLGKRGAVIVSVGAISIGTYLRSTDALFVEGRLASIMLGETAGPRAIALWRELAGLPQAISHLMWRAGLDESARDMPFYLGVYDGIWEHESDLDPSEIHVKRIDLAVDYTFASWEPSGSQLLSFAERMVVPNRMSVVYRDGGRVSVALSPSGSRRVLARIYDRAASTGAPIGETVRAEAQLRWRPDRRPTLAEVLDVIDPEERWLHALDELLPVSPESVATAPGITGVLETYEAGLISSSVAERMIGTVIAMRMGQELWSKEGGRRRRTQLAKWGIAATSGNDPVALIDFMELRSASSCAWEESKHLSEVAA